MLHLIGLVGSLLVLTVDCNVGDSSQSKFCSETKQCLLYDQICETDQYEVRHYSAVKWLTAEDTSFFMGIAMMRTFRRLYKYINDHQIEMSAPVILKIQDGKAFWERGVYSMSFLLPAEHQDNPPKPTDDVHITEMPAMTMYVRSYSGWMTSISDTNNVGSLSSALDLVDAKYNNAYHYAVVYNGPMTMFNRHNEVWLVAKDEAVCSSSEEFDD